MKKLLVAAAMLAFAAFMASASVSQAQVIRHAAGEQARVIPNQGNKDPLCAVPVPDNYLPSYRQRYGCWGWTWWHAEWAWHEEHHWWWHHHHHHWWWRHHHWCHCHW